MLLNSDVGEDSWESLGLQGDPISSSQRRSVLDVHWKDWCWSWNPNTLAIWCEKLAHLKRPWCWERLKAGGEGDDRGWDSWMASPTQWTWVWVDAGSRWWTGRPGVLRGSHKESDTTERLNWTVWIYNDLFYQSALHICMWIVLNILLLWIILQWITMCIFCFIFLKMDLQSKSI